MSKKHDFRTVNRILGERPRLGPFPADQIFPWTLIAVVNVFIFNYLLKTSWLGTGLFVKSKGCLNSGKPEQEQFYNIKNFTRDKTNAVPTAANVKIEALSKQEKQTVVELAFKDAEVENYALTNFGVSATTALIPTGKTCLTVDEWKKTQS